jgi:FtsP/CotA-like multicopper oxidase with cupredoxin domain
MKVSNMKKTQHKSFKRSPVAALIALALTAQFPAKLAFANAAFGTNIDITGTVINVPTYYASSPQGIRPAFDPVTHAMSVTGLTVNTGTPIRKFVDALGGVYHGLEGIQANTDLQNGIPVALTEKWTNPATGLLTNDDYYEIAVVEYTERLHTDLAKATRLRGYVQIETPTIALGTGKTDITSVVQSEHIPGVYPDGTPILDAAGLQVHFVHRPHYLGPAILAARANPVRIKYTNYLPYTDATGKSVGSAKGMGGEAFIPVDETIAGGGPVTKQVFNANGTPLLNANGKPVAAPVLDQNGKPIKMGQNRVSIHWHGGDSPWTNDGTPHQWFAPRGDIAYTLKDADHPNGMGVGDSFQNVPDMANPGQGSQTLYFPMNLSGRLMMYHDHVSGLTKVNVYEGEAAGLIVYDMTELTLAANALGIALTMPTGTLASAVPLLDTVGIPLVIQDKTFVPKNVGPTAVASDGKTPASQDTKWDLTHWGQEGDFFFPHVYETNQDPNSKNGTNPVGRWDWGPWFWPVFPAQFSLPSGAYGDATSTPEAFMDTPIVNGQPYPTMTVDPKSYRFRILSVANDRSLSLGFYQAVDANGVVCDAKNTAPAVAPIAAGGAGSPLGTAQALTTPLGSPAQCTEVRMVPAMPTPGFPATWPTDGRAGGVPDPSTAGPDIVQIGNEGGLLPAVAVLKSQPVAYEQNVRNITVFNILSSQLTLMGGERADVFVDFSNYAGQTLILYNDAPTPMPGLDPRTDYYTGMGDNTASGGAYDVLSGYGPNTRTVMQFKVNATNTSGSGGVLNLAALRTALPVAYAATQPAPIIPESAYNSAFGTANVDNYAGIGTGANSVPYFQVSGVPFAVTGFKMTTGGAAYPATATATFSAPQTVGGVAATATPTVVNGVITGFTGFKAGSGYTNTSPITVTFSAPGVGGTAAAATVMTSGYAVINKAIQELFDPIFGRMNSTLAAELPFSTATVATTVPLAYIDTPIEYLDGIKDGEVQIWKVTHNGVDSHPVHFHLVNVQVINRVGWDGTIKPPAANEVGWKETLRMNPLEDVYVAVKASAPVVPFGLPVSHRLLDPSQAKDSTMYFTNIDPMTGAVPTFQPQLVGGVTQNVPTGQYSNQMTDFDNEYVWHCHILGHEEQDFMRPFIFHPTVVVPDAPAKVAVSGGKVTWVDTTPVGGVDAQGIPTAGVNAAYPAPTSSPKNEIGYKIYVNAVLDATGHVSAAAVPNAVALANATSVAAPAGATTANTVVVAYNAAGNSKAGTSATAFTAGANGAVVPPASTPGTTAAAGSSINATGLIVTVASTAGLVVGASVSGGGFPPGTTITAINSLTTFTTSLASTTPGAIGVSLTISLVAAAALPTPVASVAPGGFTQTLNANGTTTLAWTPVAGATSYTVSITEAPAAIAPALPVSLPPVITTILPVTTSVTGAAIDPTGKTVLVTSTAGLYVGGSVSGGGFPAGTTITAVTPTSFTTSVASTTPNAIALTLTSLGVPPTYTTPAALNAGSTYAFAVAATTLSGTTVAATAGLTNSKTLPPVAFTGVVDTTPGSITLFWANNALNKNNVAGLQLTLSTGATTVNKTFAATTTGVTVIGLTSAASYTFNLQAISNVAAFSSTVVGPVTLTAP